MELLFFVDSSSWEDWKCSQIVAVDFQSFQEIAGSEDSDVLSEADKADESDNEDIFNRDKMNENDGNDEYEYDEIEIVELKVFICIR